MQITPIVDWIEGTSPIPGDSLDMLYQNAALITGLNAEDWRPDKAFNRYAHCLRHKSGARALCGRKDMGTHVIMSGQALSTLRGMGVQSDAILAYCESQSMHATRIDLALDCIDAKIKIRQLYSLIKSKQVITQTKSAYMVQSSGDGLTLYIGAPQSDKHVRVYNKAAELKHKAVCPAGITDWVRIELVTMRDQALASAFLIDHEGIDTTVRSMLRAFVDFPKNGAWTRALDGETVEVGHSTKQVTNTGRWLLDVVTKTLAKESLANPEFLLEFLETTQYHYDQLTLDE